jgi:hypothetical protein
VLPRFGLCNEFLRPPLATQFRSGFSTESPTLFFAWCFHVGRRAYLARYVVCLSLLDVSFFSLFIASGFVALFGLVRATKLALTVIVVETLFTAGVSLWILYLMSQDGLPGCSANHCCHSSI